MGESSMQENSTYGLRLDQLAGLLSVGIDDTEACDGEGHDESMASLLRGQLMCPLPTGSLLFDALVMMMGRLGCDTRSLVGRTLGDVLLNPQTDVGLLQAIKDCSKRLSCALDSRAHTAIATVTYYAALASALVHHDKKISQYSYDTLERSFATLMLKKWIPPDLMRLFSRARGICHDKRDPDGNRPQRRPE